MRIVDQNKTASARVRNRRGEPAPRPREGPLTELIAGTRPRPQERVLMPHSRPSRQCKQATALVKRRPSPARHSGLAVAVLLCWGLLIAVTPELLITGNLIRAEQRPRFEMRREMHGA